MRTAVDTALLATERVRESAAVKQTMLEDGNLLELVRELGAVCVNSLEQGGKLSLFGKHQFPRGMAFSLQFTVARMIPATIAGPGRRSMLEPRPRFVRIP